METGIGEIIGYIVTFIAGGGLMTILTARFKRKKAAVEVKADEIKAMHDSIEMVYKPLINQQRDRIQELEAEVKSLREQLKQEREDRQKEINVMNNQILQITSALGMKAVDHISKNRKRLAAQDADIIDE